MNFDLLIDHAANAGISGLVLLVVLWYGIPYIIRIHAEQLRESRECFERCLLSVNSENNTRCGANRERIEEVHTDLIRIETKIEDNTKAVSDNTKAVSCLCDRL